MLPAIDFDYQMPIATYEIDEIQTDRLLPDELATIELAISQPSPQQQLCLRVLTP